MIPDSVLRCSLMIHPSSIFLCEFVPLCPGLSASVSTSFSLSPSPHHTPPQTLRLNTTTMAKLLAIMTTVVSLSFFSKLRPIVAFQAPVSARRHFATKNANAAFGRTTFRHLPGDLVSWRMTSSSGDETEAKTTTTATSDLDIYSNKNNLDDQVFSAISADGGLKVTVATVRNLLNEMMIQHSMNPVAGDALGRATICGLLASNGMQEEQMFQLSMKGDGPLRGVVSIVNGKGRQKDTVAIQV